MNIDDRMKMYEGTYQTEMPRRMPVVMRLDGKTFHTLTRNCERPFDKKLWQAIVGATQDLLEETHARVAYQQSDEVSLLFIDYNKFDSEQWVGGSTQKMVSISASIMGVGFSSRWGSPGYFDSRVMGIPERDVLNYFVWRQQDCMRNAVAMAARTEFSQKQLYGKHIDEQKTMLGEKGVKFDEYEAVFRFGTVVTKEGHHAAPVFSNDRDFLKKFLSVEEE